MNSDGELVERSVKARAVAVERHDVRARRVPGLLKIVMGKHHGFACA